MGTHIVFDSSERFKFFTRKRRAEWPQLFRIVLGQVPYRNRKPMIQWATDNAHGRFSASGGGEVFIFEDSTSAAHFKLRWLGHPPIDKDNPED